MRTLYRARNVHTFGYPASGEWILVDGRHVQRVGSGEPPPADRVVDLPGATIMPGFTDAHVHLTATGLQQRWPQAAAATSREAFMGALTDVASATSDALCSFGFDESKWADSRLPSPDELDAISSAPVIAVRADGHLSLANRAALTLSDVLALDGVQRDEHGAPTGVVTKAANDQLQRWFIEHLSDAEIEALQLEAAAIAASHGVTCVHEMSMPRASGTRDVEILLAHRAHLPVAVVPYIATTDIGWVLDLGLPRIGGDLSLDGSLGARTALLSADYADAPGERGTSYYSDDELLEFLRTAHGAGLQVAMHVIGDAAIEQALRAWEQVVEGLDSRLRRHFRVKRHRLEHAEMPTEPHIDRIAALGLSVSVQPAFDATWGTEDSLYETRVGHERAARMNPFRSFTDRGIDLGLGSDSPITALEPFAAVAALEMHHQPDQRLDRRLALDLLVHGGPRIAGMDRKGKLEPGSHADFAAFAEDPFAAIDIAALRPHFVVSHGRDVFSA